MKRLGNLGVQLLAVGSQEVKNGLFHAGSLVDAFGWVRILSYSRPSGKPHSCAVWMREQSHAPGCRHRLHFFGRWGILSTPLSWRTDERRAEAEWAGSVQRRCAIGTGRRQDDAWP